MLRTPPHYTSPKFYRETLSQQIERLEQERHALEMRHAIKMANQRLYYLQTRRMLGTEMSSLEVEVTMTDHLRMEGVLPELIPAAVGLVLERYRPII
jgi:hypothetical protein